MKIQKMLNFGDITKEKSKRGNKTIQKMINSDDITKNDSKRKKCEII